MVPNELEAINSLAVGIVAHPRGQPPPKPAKNPFAVALGKLGASKGGMARAKSLSPRRRKQIAREAAIKRWANQPDNT